MTLLDRVKDLCREKGISQGKMEKEIEISNGASSKWKNSSPSLEILQKLSAYFGVTVDYLMNGESETTHQQSYYLDTDTAKMAQELKDNKELKLLFDASRDASPEDLKQTADYLMFLKKKERGE